MGKGAGGLEYFNVPKVWSPSGGWWCKPVNWQRNTKLAAVAIFPVACYIFATSVDKEQRFAPGRPAPYVNTFGRKENPQPRAH